MSEKYLSLNLSDEDAKRIFEKAGAVGLTVSELIEAFIGDLIDGSNTHGSDERMYAEQWFNRCGFEYTCPHTFVWYLNWHGYLKAFLDLCVDNDSDRDELASIESQDEKELDDMEVMRSIQESIADRNIELSQMFNDYAAQAGQACSSRSLEEATQEVKAWFDGMQKFCSGRYVELPIVNAYDMGRFADGLHDYFAEASVVDRDAGLYGMTDGEAKLAAALMDAIEKPDEKQTNE